MPVPVSKLLLDILRSRRPAGSRSEVQFVSRFIDGLPGIQRDSFGNRLLIHPTSRTMISVHTDTVHRMEGEQRLYVRDGFVDLHHREQVSNCLGADDGAGVYAALRMIDAGVAASFFFHRDEEHGGRGSAYLADYRPDLLQRYDRCIALDRRGTTDIITEQFFARCCSDAFALALSEALGMGHVLESGTFTDSANYTHLIPECTNLSVGYQNEHTRLEYLDVEYLERLILRLCEVDYDALLTVRDCADTLSHWDELMDWPEDDSLADESLTAWERDVRRMRF